MQIAAGLSLPDLLLGLALLSLLRLLGLLSRLSLPLLLSLPLDLLFLAGEGSLRLLVGVAGAADSCRNGHVSPLLHLPDLKNLQGTLDLSLGLDLPGDDRLGLLPLLEWLVRLWDLELLFGDDEAPRACWYLRLFPNLHLPVFWN